MAAENQSSKTPVRVEIVGVDIPFYDLIMLIVKFALAAIPAGIILLIFATAILALLGRL